MVRTLHLAILVCDTPVDAVKTSLGGYGDVFEKRIREALKDHNTVDLDLQISKWDVVQTSTFPSLDKIDAVLLSGSKHTAFHDDPWIVSLVEYVSKAIEKPGVGVFGFCFGHQIIARALGATVGVSSGGWETSVCKVNLSTTGQELFGKGSLNVHHMHRDGVQSLPAGTINLGSSPSCAIQGLYRPRKILTLQSHPEFNEFIMRNIVHTRHQQSIFSDDMAADSLLRAGEPHDGMAVFALVLDVMAEI